MNHTVGLKMAAAMKALNDPLAPNKLTEAHNAAEALGKCIAQSGTCTKEQARATLDRLLVGFTDHMLDEEGVRSSPEFICALCNALATSISAYCAKL